VPLSHASLLPLTFAALIHLGEMSLDGGMNINRCHAICLGHLPNSCTRVRHCWPRLGQRCFENRTVHTDGHLLLLTMLPDNLLDVVHLKTMFLA
jgi:hypothetical protein